MKNTPPLLLVAVVLTLSYCSQVVVCQDQVSDQLSGQQQLRTQQTPWQPLNMLLDPGQWRGQHRSLLQNPQDQGPDRNGRNGRMEDYVPTGYGLESYTVWTPDGWALKIFRLPHGNLRHKEPGKRPVVLLLHGFSLSSLSFVLYNPNESIGYILADAGFDVWFLNTRGNDFSRGNLHHSFTEAEYWYITMDDMALIDLPVTINYILDKTGANKLQMLTHSQGGTLVYMMLAAMPEMQNKVASLIAMGPPVFMEYMRAPALRNYANARNDLFFVDGWHGWGEFLTSRRLWPFTRQCQQGAMAELCARATFIMFYGPSDQISIDDFTVILNTWPGTVSTRNIVQWGQMIKDKRFRLQRFDYGTNCANLTRYRETCNQQVYGALEPPEYCLRCIKTPVFIMQGSADIMVVEEDAAEQERRIPGAVRINYDRWSHMDFIWDRSQRHAPDVVELFYRFSPGTF